MACFLSVILFVRYELSYDRYHQNADRLFRVITEAYASTPAPLGPALRSDFPEVEVLVRTTMNSMLMQYRDKRFYEDRIMLADPTLFQVFTFTFLSGDEETALQDPHSIIFTETTARKYFGDADPIGKTVILGGRTDFTITGLIEDIPRNTHFQCDFIIPFTLVNEFSNYDYLSSWGAWNFRTYVRLNKKISARHLESSMADFLRRHTGERFTDTTLRFQPVTGIHFQTEIRRYVTLFSAVGILILIVACINFMNLASAHSMRRKREVGLRKVIGARKGQLVGQFLSESLVLSFTALPLAVCLMSLFVPVLGRLVGESIRIGIFSDPLPWIAFIGIAICVGFVSGSYPAFFATAFRPSDAVRGGIRRSYRRNRLRNFLVIVQFIISIILIISTLVIASQMQFIKNKDLGYEHEHLVNIRFGGSDRSQYEAFKTELMQYPEIVNITASGFSVYGYAYQSVVWEGLSAEEDPMMNWFPVDMDFIETFRIELVEGRGFMADFPSDINTNYILNESAVRRIGWDSAAGKGFQVLMAGNGPGTVVGVVKDFHFRSLHHEIRPLALYLLPRSCNFAAIRIVPGRVEESLRLISEVWRMTVPDRPFEYWFWDETFDNLYRMEQKSMRFFSYLSSLSLFIACLGLLGLVSFIIEQRRKEIGIRKVLGATTPDIMTRLVRKFALLILVANIVAWPIGYVLMKRWLAQFAYRSPIEPWIFIVSTSGTLCIALAVLCLQTVRAAFCNPVESIRYE